MGGGGGGGVIPWVGGWGGQYRHGIKIHIHQRVFFPLDDHIFVVQFHRPAILQAELVFFAGKQENWA